MEREPEMIWKSLTVEIYHINNDVSVHVNSRPVRVLHSMTGGIP